MVRTPTEPAAPRSLHLWHSYMPRRAPLLPTSAYLGAPAAFPLPRDSGGLVAPCRRRAYTHSRTRLTGSIDRQRQRQMNVAVVRPRQHKRTEPLGLRALVVSGVPFARMVCKRRPTRADPHRKAPGPVRTGGFGLRDAKGCNRARHFGCDLEPVGDLEQSTVVVVPIATGDATCKVQRRRTGTTRRTDVYAADADAAAQRCTLYARAMPYFPP